MKKILPRFHLAFPVNNLDNAKKFYSSVLGCSIGRQSENWVDFNFYGHQIVAHLSPDGHSNDSTNNVDGNQVPSRHFGVILSYNHWERLSKSLIDKKVEFLIEPNIRFKNKNGEQGTFFIKDLSGNVLEFKYFQNDQMIFEENELNN